MIIPVRCMTCGRPIAGLWEKYKERVGKGENPKKVLDDLGVEKYCCRAIFLTHKDILSKTSRFRA